MGYLHGINDAIKVTLFDVINNSDDESDDDGDACVEIPLVTPIRFVTVIPSSGNQDGSSVAPIAEDSRGKGIMVDDDAAPSAGASRPRPSSGSVPLFRDIFGDAIHADFFPFYAGRYYATYPEGGAARNCEFTREEWDAPYQPTFRVLTKEVFKDPAIFKTVVDEFFTPGEMVLVESLYGDQLTVKMSVLHCMMMSHDGEFLAQYCGLLQSHHEVSGLWVAKIGCWFECKLSTSDAAFSKSKAKGKERKKKIKSLSKSLGQLNAEVARLFTALNQATILEAEKDEEIFRLKATSPEFASFFQDELLSLAASAGFERGLSMHRAKDEFVAVLKKMAHFVPGAHESIVTPASESLDVSAIVFPASSAVASEQNEEPGTSYVLDDVAEVTVVGSGRVSSGLTDVVMALSVLEKGDGSLPSFAADEEATANPSGV
ncbi:hypothetical protein Tco_1213303 [Tanacetum coccineum]